jgi:hypothetical protein
MGVAGAEPISANINQLRFDKRVFSVVRGVL